MNSQAVCSCQNEFIGSPPNCRPECTINSECASNKACVNRKCVDPCINQCAKNANCRVIAHSPICSCKDRFTGDSFVNCVPSKYIIYKLVNILISYNISGAIFLLLFQFLLRFHRLLQLTLAYHRRVDPIHNVKNSVALLDVLAFQIILARHLNAGQSVQ